MKDQTFSVLLIEDNAMDALLMKRAFLSSSIGAFNITHVDRVTDAVDRLGKERFDVILLDLSLPDSHGIPTLTKVHSHASSIPIVVLTGLDDEKIALQAVREGAQDYVVKGQTDNRMLLRIVRYAIERHRVEERLRESEEDFRRIIETTQEGIWTINSDNLISFVNHQFARMVGYQPDDMIGCPIFDFMDNEAREVAMLNLKNLARGVQDEEVFRFQRRDGTDLWTRIVLSPLNNKAGHYVGALAMVNDLTENKRLENEVLEISGREQRRIGQDLHDGLCQHLSGIIFHCKVLEQKLQQKSPSEANDLLNIMELLSQGVTQAQNMARTLYPAELEAKGFVAALRDLTIKCEQMFHIECTFKCNKTLIINDLSISTQLYRITQEAIHNAFKHGHAKKVDVELTITDDRTNLTIRDNGCGFPENLGQPKGMGVRIMKYRAQVIKASLSIQRAPDCGTIVKCTFQNKDLLSKDVKVEGEGIAYPLLTEKTEPSNSSQKAVQSLLFRK